MFMTGCVVVMSSCHDKDTDRLWCVNVKVSSQTMSYLHSKCHNWANDT